MLMHMPITVEEYIDENGRELASIRAVWPARSCGQSAIGAQVTAAIRAAWPASSSWY